MNSSGRTAAVLIFAGSLVAVSGADTPSAKGSVKDDARTAGHAIAHGASATGHTIAEKSREAGHAISDGTRSTRDTIRDDSKKAGHAVAEGARNLSRTVHDGFQHLKASMSGKSSTPEPQK